MRVLGDHSLNEAVGPFYDTDGVCAVLGGISQQAVAARRRAHTILAVKTRDGRWAYPTAQFTGCEVNPTLVPAIRELREAPDWATAAWFTTKNPDLGGVAPVNWVLDGGSPRDMIASARRTAAEWR